MVVPVSQEGFKLSNRFDSSTVRCSMQTMNYDLAVRISTRRWTKRHDDRPGYEVQQNGHNGHEGIPKEGALPKARKLDSYA